MPETNGVLPVKNLEGALEETFGFVPKLQSIQWRYLTDPGDNFGSLILAVDAELTEDKPRSLHLVAKMPPTSEYLLDLFNSPATFRKELYFYKQVAPRFLEIQLENGTPKDDLIKLFPYYHGGRLGLRDPEAFDDQALIVLENLNHSGYKVQDRIVGMDKQHMEYAVKELSKLHAIPVALKMKKPKVFKEIILPGLASHFNETTMSCVKDMINKARTNLKNTDLGKKLEDRIDRTIEHALSPNHGDATEGGPWKSLVHCDFWVNNMMFCYNDRGSISGMKIVDFQLSLYEHCIDDLIFFLMSSARHEDSEKNLDNLLDLYYESFVSNLRSLNVDTEEFTRESFDKAVRERAPMKFPQSIMMIQVIKATRGTAPDVQSIEKKEQFLEMGKGQLYNKKLLQVLEIFHKKDWLVR